MQRSPLREPSVASTENGTSRRLRHQHVRFVRRLAPLARCQTNGSTAAVTGTTQLDTAKSRQMNSGNFPTDEDGRTYHVGTKVRFIILCGSIPAGHPAQNLTW